MRVAESERLPFPSVVHPDHGMSKLDDWRPWPAFFPDEYRRGDDKLVIR